ncbi:uncharacterized protein M6G45_012333 isoform 1-T9 [Spheniscus humboldti]
MPFPSDAKAAEQLQLQNRQHCQRFCLPMLASDTGSRLDFLVRAGVLVRLHLGARAWSPLGLEANHSTVRRGRMRENPGYRLSCTDIQCGQNAGVMTSRHAENRSHPTFFKSLQCDFLSLVFSEHELRRKRDTHEHRTTFRPPAWVLHSFHPGPS